MIIFDVSKSETYHPNANFKRLCQRLRTVSKVRVNKDGISSYGLRNCDLLVLGNPQASFGDEELRVLGEYVDGGGSLAVFSAEGGAQPRESNLNELLAGFGIAIDRATLVRAAYHRYLHPKHALIQNGIVQPEVGREKHAPLNANGGRRQRRGESPGDGVEPSTSLSFVYPNGTTLAVQSPAYTLLSSGSTSYPVDCPIAAAWESTSVGGGQGRVLVVGSCDVFADDWLEKEENSQLCDVLFRFLLRQDVSFDPSVGRSDFEEKECVPDVASLSSMVKPCLHENEPLPQDCKTMLCEDLFGVTNDLVPDVVDLYEQLNVPCGPLTLVEPHFECPHPPLRMATHQPRMLDPPPPTLELFDLDECFEDVRVRLARLTNKCSNDEDLDYYIQESGWILGLDMQEGGESRNGQLSKQLLHHIGKKLFQFKMQNP